jgi:hypothetical protein
MSGTGLREMPVNATLGDCARLWHTLTTEYIPGLRIEWRILENANGVAILSVEVVDDSLESLDGRPLVNVWSKMHFQSGLYLISYRQLFDLLITAYHHIDAFFKNGTPSAPARRYR